MQQTLAPSRRGRSTTGCIGCRLRRKKCGEEAPHCANCQRNGLLCTYPRGDNTLHSALLRRTNPTGRRSPGGRARASRSPTVSTVVMMSTEPAEATNEPAEQTTTTSSPSPRDAADTIPPWLDVLLSRGPLRHARSRHFFDHYMHRTARVMAVCQGTRNPFLGELLPLAVESNLVLNALVAFSGIHYANQAGVAVDEAAWLHYGQTLQGAKAGLTQLASGDRDCVVPLLVTTLLLCGLETFRADGGSHALQHLLAARALLQEALALPDARLGPTLRRFLVERYIYIVILAHISMGHATDQWVVDDTALLFAVLGDAAATASCVHALFRLIPRVSCLAHRWCAAAQDGRAPAASERTERDRLARELAAWQPASDDEAHTVCGRLYQQALLVYLAAACGGAGDGEGVGDGAVDDVDAALDRVLPFLAAIPLGAVTSTTLCWPLVILGACARQPAHRAALAARLDALSTTYAARSVRDAKLLLETHWATAGCAALAHPPGLEQTMRKGNRTVLFL